MGHKMTDTLDADLKAAFNFIENGKLRRAKMALARAVGWTEVEWNECTFKLFPADNVSDKHFWAKGTPDEQSSILKLVSLVEGQKITFWDVGANCGVYSVVVSKKCADGSSIFSFEPNPEMHKRLRKNLTANGLTKSKKKSVETRNIALGAEHGQLDLHIYEGNLGRATLRTDDVKAQDRKITVPVEPIEDYIVQGLDGSLKVLKIDVEGYEDRILMPWVRKIDTLGDIDYLLLEHTHRAHWGEDVIDALEAKGYKSVFIGDGNTLMASPAAVATSTD
jgi:FkbM family methyltransferase